MGRRLELQALLEVLLGSDQVYFQPPGSQSMSYPAITYKLDDIDTSFANNLPYRFTDRYELTLIQRLPGEDLVDKLKVLPMCAFGRHYVMNNLNHYIFILYF